MDPALILSDIEPINLLILEDDRFIAEVIKHDLYAALDRKYTNIDITDNLEQASDLIFSDQCEIFLVDLIVKDKKGSKIEVDAIPLLKKIIDEQLFVTSIAHTAYGHWHEEVRRDNLAEVALLKSPDNNEELINNVVDLFNDRQKLNSTIRRTLNNLYSSATESDIVEAQGYLDEARNIIGNYKIYYKIPKNHKKFLYWLVSFIMRLSTVDSPELGIKKIEADIINGLEEMRKLYENPSFRYSEALDIMGGLEAKGYPVLIRVSDY
jgi:hypothetical protein